MARRNPNTKATVHNASRSVYIVKGSLQNSPQASVSVAPDPPSTSPATSKARNKSALTTSVILETEPKATASVSIAPSTESSASTSTSATAVKESSSEIPKPSLGDQASASTTQASTSKARNTPLTKAKTLTTQVNTSVARPPLAPTPVRPNNTQKYRSPANRLPNQNITRPEPCPNTVQNYCCGQWATSYRPQMMVTPFVDSYSYIPYLPPYVVETMPFLLASPEPDYPPVPSNDSSKALAKRQCYNYNHGGCNNLQCRDSHEPDGKSVRDKLERNVCGFFLADDCWYDKKGTCRYCHDKSELHEGWWDFPELVTKANEFVLTNNNNALIRRQIVVQLTTILLPEFETLMRKKTEARVLEEVDTGDTLPGPKDRVVLGDISCNFPLNSPRRDATSEKSLPVFTVPVRLNSVFGGKKSQSLDEPPSPSESFILQLSLAKQGALKNRDSCIKGISEKFGIENAETEEKALKLLSSAHLFGVFVTDGAIIKSERKELLKKLVEYVEKGGRIVLGGSFSDGLSPVVSNESDSNHLFWSTWGVPWKTGSFDSNIFITNVSNDLVGRYSLVNYDMKALTLRNVSSKDAIYVSHGIKLLPDAEPVLLDSPCIFTSVGKGTLGYVGDVNWEENLKNVILAMFDMKTVVHSTELSVQAQEIPSLPDLASQFVQDLPDSILEPLEASFSPPLSAKTEESTQEDALSSTLEIPSSQPDSIPH